VLVNGKSTTREMIESGCGLLMPAGLKGDFPMEDKRLARKGAKILFVLFLCSLPPSVIAAATLDQVFAKMDDTAKGFHSIECDLEQTKVTTLVDDKFVQSGKLYYALVGKEPRLKLEIGKPKPQQIVLIDKGKAQRFIPKINEVQEVSLGGRACGWRIRTIMRQSAFDKARDNASANGMKQDL
jgi:hypothetical protein